MKKLVIVLVIGLMIAGFAYAAVQKVNVEKDVAGKVLQAKRIMTTTAGQLLNIRDTVAEHSSEIDAGDLTKLNAIKVDLNLANANKDNK